MKKNRKFNNRKATRGRKQQTIIFYKLLNHTKEFKAITKVIKHSN